MRVRVETWLTLAVVALFFGLVAWAEASLNPYYQRILNTAFVYVVAAVGYNLINGITGQFSLGPNAFMALGGYTAALLVLPLAQKQAVWFLQPLMWPFNAFSLPGSLFIVAVLAAGIVASLGGLLVGYPSLRLKGDYLAIATFGFGEIVFVLANNLIPLTNGALGIKAIPGYTNLWWSGGAAAASVLLVRNLALSSFGRAMRAVREDEVAAEAMGVNVFRTKLLAFIVSAFLGGIAGALLTTLITTISPTLFTFAMTFNLLIIIVLGGLGSLTGSVVTAVLFALLQELLRSLEAPMRIGAWTIPGIPGMRMVVFSLLLVILMVFYRRGLFGRSELSWELVLRRFARRRHAHAPDV